MSDVAIRTPNGEMPAYMAVPGGVGPWPGVVVVHDFAGMTRDLRNQADWLAAGHGYAASGTNYGGCPADMTPLLTLLSKISGTRYHQASAADAHRRIAAFCSRHLMA